MQGFRLLHLMIDYPGLENHLCMKFNDIKSLYLD